MSGDNVADPSKDELELLFAAEQILLKVRPENANDSENPTSSTLCNLAEALGYEDALKLLKQNLDEEESVEDSVSMPAGTSNHFSVASDNKTHTSSIGTVDVPTPNPERAETDLSDDGT